MLPSVATFFVGYIMSLLIPRLYSVSLYYDYMNDDELEKNWHKAVVV
jgi:hypothetical protein